MIPSPSIDAGHLLNGRYRIEALVAARPGTTSFAATDLTCGERVSLQVHAAGAPGARDWLLGGVAWAQTLVGPHIAKILDAGMTPAGEPWIVREHIPSASLAMHLARSGPLKLGDAIDVVLAVCDALAEAHGKQVLHGGLGPHAVFAAWSASGLVDVKVIGIGTALAESALTLGATGAPDGLLRSPEQVRQAPIDARADLWSLGALLHTLLTGMLPFRPEGPSILVDAPAPLQNVPAPLAAIVARTLAKDPAERPQHVLELAEQLSFYATSPEFARERITARRPALGRTPEGRAAPPLPRTSAPAIAIDRRPFIAAAAPAEDFEITRRQPLLMVQPPRMMRRPRRAEQTVLVRPAQPRRRVLKILAGVTAAASIVLLTLLATEARSAQRMQAEHPAPETTAIAAATNAPVPCYPAHP